jgi:sulfite exporter TauE/SafE
MHEVVESSQEQPHPRAVKFGRLVFVLVGAVFFGVACWFSYKNPSSRVLFSALVMGAGLVLIWLGVVLPPKVVAHLGFWLPGLLPSE